MKTLQKTTSILTIAALLSYAGFLVIEPQFVRAQSVSEDESVTVTLSVTTGIAIEVDGANVDMGTLSMDNLVATGDATWTVRTNGNDGYNLAVAASGSPALHEVDTPAAGFSDYVQGTPAAWNVTNDYAFGFSVFGDAVASATWGAGTSCEDSGAVPADLNYLGFNGTADIEVVDRNGVTSTSGEDTTICFAAEQAGVYAPSGDYTATITATATSN